MLFEFTKKVLALLPKPIGTAIKNLRSALRLRGSERMATLALNLTSRKPKTLQAKVRYKMLKDRSPDLFLFADKVRVRDFVLDRIGDQYLSRAYGTFHTMGETKRDDFPRDFVVKANHGSGAVVICWERAPRGKNLLSTAKVDWTRRLIHPDDLVWDDLIKLTDKWMKQNYYWARGRYPEWAYSQIPPQILVEELILIDGALPFDYRVYTMGGVCQFIRVNSSIFGETEQATFTRDWLPIRVRSRRPQMSSPLPRPHRLQEMVEAAERLARGTDFLRCDFYISKERIVFGELTIYPSSGQKIIGPRFKNIELAKNWTQNY